MLYYLSKHVNQIMYKLIQHIIHRLSYIEESPSGLSILLCFLSPMFFIQHKTTANVTLSDYTLKTSSDKCHSLFYFTRK